MISYSLFHLTLALWIGSLFFVTLIAIPTLYQKLTQDEANKASPILRSAMNRTSAILGPLSFVLFVIHAARLDFFPYTRLILLFLMGFGALYNDLVALPRIKGLQEELNALSDDTFRHTVLLEHSRMNQRLHWINLFIALAGIVVLFRSHTPGL